MTDATLAARIAVDEAGDALTALYDALRSTRGPTWAQLTAFDRAAIDAYEAVRAALTEKENAS